jgi:hypothetical protein
MMLLSQSERVKTRLFAAITSPSAVARHVVFQATPTRFSLSLIASLSLSSMSLSTLSSPSPSWSSSSRPVNSFSARLSTSAAGESHRPDAGPVPLVAVAAAAAAVDGNVDVDADVAGGDSNDGGDINGASREQRLAAALTRNFAAHPVTCYLFVIGSEAAAVGMCYALVSAAAVDISGDFVLAYVSSASVPTVVVIGVRRS